MCSVPYINHLIVSFQLPYEIATHTSIFILQMRKVRHREIISLVHDHKSNNGARVQIWIVQLQILGPKLYIILPQVQIYKMEFLGIPWQSSGQFHFKGHTLVSGQGTKILHAKWPKKKTKKKTPYLGIYIKVDCRCWFFKIEFLNTCIKSSGDTC